MGVAFVVLRHAVQRKGLGEFGGYSAVHDLGIAIADNLPWFEEIQTNSTLHRGVDGIFSMEYRKHFFSHRCFPNPIREANVPSSANSLEADVVATFKSQH